MNTNKKTIIIIAAMIVIIVVLAIVLTNVGTKTTTISYSELVEHLNYADDNDEKVVGIYFVNDYKCNVLYKKDETENNLKKFKQGKYKSATCTVTYRNALVLAIENSIADDNLDSMPYIQLNDPDSGSFVSYIFSGLSLAVMIILAIVIVISIKGGKGSGGAMNFGKTKARVGTHLKVRFNDVAGAEEEKEELKEIVEFLKSPKKFRSVGARVPKGVLLVGNPGTGKTLFAKAVAGEANVPFYSISGSDFVEMFVGVGASRVRDLFAQAKKTQPCIVFIDEIDAVGRKRGAGLGGGNDEREQTLNQLLVQMDGFDENDGIIIMAATNRVDVLDPALLRPGRFDRQIYVHMPDVKGREAILKVHARNKPLANDIDFKTLARLTTGFSGADIENLLNEAAILTARDNRVLITNKDIQEGINKVIAGPQKKSRVVTERDKRITAYHEAGHAIVGRLMKYCDAVQEVSIIPRGMAAGYTISRPKTDDSHITKNRLNDEIAMMLGGRAAESIVIEDISTGASQDIKQATSSARSMVTEWGMSEALPNTFFGGEQEVFIGRDYQTQSTYSDKTAAIIDSEIEKIINTNYQRALAILKENIEGLHATVKLLFEHETIYGDELDMILAGKSVEEVTEYIKQKKEQQEEMEKAKERENKDKERRSPLGNPKDFIVKEMDNNSILIIPANTEQSPADNTNTDVDKPDNENDNDTRNDDKTDIDNN